MNSLVDEVLPMLTDLALKKLKLKDKSYKMQIAAVCMPLSLIFVSSGMNFRNKNFAPQ
jgi:hypothetical protein